MDAEAHAAEGGGPPPNEPITPPPPAQPSSSQTAKSEGVDGGWEETWLPQSASFKP